MPDLNPVTLLRDVVPSTLADTVRMAHAAGDGRISLIDLLIHDGHLRSLIHKIHTVHDGLPPTGLRTEELDDLNVTSEGGMTARAAMAFCPESVLIVHGPIMLGRIIALARQALPQGRSAVGFKCVRFHRPVIRDVMLHLVPADTHVPENAPLTGQLVDDAGKTWTFAAVPIAESPVTHWIDNWEVIRTIAISSASDSPVRHFHLRSAGRKDWCPTLAEAVQILIETVVRAVVAHRSRDGRAILLTGISHVSWPGDLAKQIAENGIGEIVAEPGTRLSDDRPWHGLKVSLSGGFGTGSFNFVEGHTTLTEIFKTLPS